MALIKPFIKCVLWNNSEKYVWQGVIISESQSPVSLPCMEQTWYGRALSLVSNSRLSWGERKPSYVTWLVHRHPSSRPWMCLHPPKKWKVFSITVLGFLDTPWPAFRRVKLLCNWQSRGSTVSNVIFLSPSHYLGKIQRDVFWRFYVGFFFFVTPLIGQKCKVH